MDAAARGSCRRPRGIGGLPPLGTLLAGFLLAATGQTEPLTLVVDTTEDALAKQACTPAPADCSLRGALQKARSLPERTTIRLPAGSYALEEPNSCSFQTLQFGSSSVQNSVTLCVVGPVTLIGDGADATVIDAESRDRVLVAGSGHPIEIRGVTIRGGWQRGGSLYGGGGGINAAGELRIVDSVLTEHNSDISGGAIYNSGKLELLRTTVTRSEAVSDGGGLFNYSQSSISAADSLVSDNVSGANGGGIMNFQGTVTLSGTTVSGNRSSFVGGGVWSQGGNFTARLLATNATLTGNQSQASYGGGLYNGFLSEADLRNVTVTANRAGAASSNGIGGGISNSEGGALRLRNSLVAGNTASYLAPDCYDGGRASTVTSAGHNLIGAVNDECTLSGDTTGNVTGQAPGLAPLAGNGGYAPTHALLEASPAVDAGSPEPPGAGGAACAPADQRGRLRPAGVRCDIGAFERSGAFAVHGIVPARGGNTGLVTVRVSGDAFTDGTAVKLVREGAEVAGAAVHPDEGGASLGASFDLSGRGAGAWDVVVTNPDGATASLPGAFQVEPGMPASLWVNVTGRKFVRAGRTARYTVLYGNRGNVDARGVPLTVTVSSSYALALLFPVAPPPPQPGQAAIDWRDDVPLTVRPDGIGRTNVPLVLPVVPAGFTGALPITITTPPGAQDEALYAVIGKPYFDPALSPDTLEAFVAGARAYAERNLAVSVPAARLPELRQYVTGQLGLAVARGQDALTASAGSDPEVLSLVHLQVDAALFIAARIQAGGGASLGQDPMGALAWRPLRMLAERFLGALARIALPAEAHAGPCSGRVLADGEQCGDNPNPVPPPDTGPEKPMTPAECRDLPNHEVSADGTRCQPTSPNNCSKIKCLPNPLAGTDPRCTCYPIGPKSGIDPNEKHGPQGGGAARFTAEKGELAYSILFENLESATAPAADVVITDPLDLSKLDAATFELGPIHFGRTSVRPVPGSKEFRGAVDLRPAKNLLVLIEAGLNAASGVATWRFTSIDPDLGGPSEDPEQGFLPPNVTPPEGDGSVLFTIRAKPGTTTGTTLCNEASIVFDANAPIATPRWCNSFDFQAPVSQVDAALPDAVLPEAEVSWSGSDTGSAVESYSVFVSEDGGPFSAWLTDSQLTSAHFSGKAGSRYDFYTTARDQGGNVEAPPALPDRSVTLAAPSPDTDGDGVPDAIDDCTLVANPDQTDADGDGFGNACDGDYNGDGIVNFLDLARMKQQFLKPDPVVDLTGDGLVNFADLARLRQLFFKAPGPKGQGAQGAGG